MLSTALLSVALLFSQPLAPMEYYNKPEEIREIHQQLSPWKEHIDTYAEQYQIDPDLITAVIHVESRGNPSAISHVGAQGLMQIMPRTGKSLGLDNAFDAKENIRAGTQYIAMLMRNYNNDEYNMLWAWNAGGRRVANGVMPSETRVFINRVLMLKGQL